MSAIVGKVLTQPRFLRHIIIEQSKLSMIKQQTYSLSAYTLQSEPEKMILVFSQDPKEKTKPSIEVTP